MKILFLCHNATRTGAPIVLLNLIQWIKENTAIEVEVLVKDYGELVNDFKRLSTTYLLNQRQPKSFVLKNIAHLLNKIFKNRFREFYILKNLESKKFDLIYANTLASTDLIVLIRKKLDIPCICHVHELEVTIKDYCDVEKFNAAKNYINRYIAVAEAVRKNLIVNHCIPLEKISMIPPPIVVKNLSSSHTDSVRNTIFPGALNNSFIVCGSGVTGWRKGSDLFLSLAKIVQELRPKNSIYFLWVGYVDEVTRGLYEHDIEKCGINDRVHFSGQQRSAVNYFASADIFLLTSREDPFPLVCMEAAALGKPILCFEDAGGMSDFVINNDCGSVVPYMSLLKMAEEIIFYSENEKIVSQRGLNGKAAVKNYDISIIAKSILSEIEMTLKS